MFRKLAVVCGVPDKVAASQCTVSNITKVELTLDTAEEALGILMYLQEHFLGRSFLSVQLLI